VRLCDALFSSIASTYQKHAPVMSLLNLSLVSMQTFLEGAMALPDSDKVGSSSSNDSAVS
jgi:hypothetical protein